jgi:hypothetical protein
MKPKVDALAGTTVPTTRGPRGPARAPVQATERGGEEKGEATRPAKKYIKLCNKDDFITLCNFTVL